MALENKVRSFKHHWIFLSGFSVLLWLRVHYYYTELQLKNKQNSMYLAPWTYLLRILFTYIPNLSVSLSARCTSSVVAWRHLNSSSIIYLLYHLVQMSYLFLNFLICKRGKMVGPIQLINLMLWVLNIHTKIQRIMPCPVLAKLPSLRALSSDCPHFWHQLQIQGVVKTTARFDNAMKLKGPTGLTKRYYTHGFWLWFIKGKKTNKNRLKEDTQDRIEEDSKEKSFHFSQDVLTSGISVWQYTWSTAYLRCASEFWSPEFLLGLHYISTINWMIDCPCVWTVSSLPSPILCPQLSNSNKDILITWEIKALKIAFQELVTKARSLFGSG